MEPRPRALVPTRLWSRTFRPTPAAWRGPGLGVGEPTARLPRPHPRPEEGRAQREPPHAGPEGSRVGEQGWGGGPQSCPRPASTQRGSHAPAGRPLGSDSDGEAGRPMCQLPAQRQLAKGTSGTAVSSPPPTRTPRHTSWTTRGSRAPRGSAASRERRPRFHRGHQRLARTNS